MLLPRFLVQSTTVLFSTVNLVTALPMHLCSSLRLKHVSSQVWLPVDQSRTYALGHFYAAERLSSTNFACPS